MTGPRKDLTEVRDTHCCSGQKKHRLEKKLIAAVQTIIPSINSEAALLLAGEGTISAWIQEQMPTQMLEAQPIYTGLECFTASLMKVLCPDYLQELGKPS